MKFTKSKTLTTDIAISLLLGLMVLGVLVPVSPANMPVAGRDSGVFLYTGWRILKGEMPYMDVWDHKPPVIFYINAIGLQLSNNSRWGVWGIEVISLYIAAMIAFLMLRKAFDTFSAIVSLFVMLLTMVFMLEGGNFTTEYTIPLQFACLWMAWKSESQKHSFRYDVSIGLLSGILFLTKQNTIGVFLSIMLYILLSRTAARNWRELVQRIIIILSVFVAVLAIVAILFAVRGGLDELWNAAFSYNFYYAAEPSFGDHAQSIYRAWILLSKTYLVWFGFLGWSVALTSIIFARNEHNTRPGSLISIGLINLPIELIFAAMGGRLINHHFMTLLPIFTLFSALFFHLFFRGLRNWFGNVSSVRAGIATASVILLTIPLTYLKPLRDYVDIALGYRNDETRAHDVVQLILRRTYPTDTVLVLEAESYINFAAGRKSPTKYVYQYPLNMPDFTTKEMVESFLNDIVHNPPTLIVDKSGKWIEADNFAARSDGIVSMVAQIKGKYRELDRIGPWIIYEAE